MTERRKLTPEEERERAESYARSEALLMSLTQNYINETQSSTVRLLDPHEDKTDDFITKEDIPEIPEGVEIPSSNGSEVEDVEEPEEEIDYDEIEKQAEEPETEGEDELWRAILQGF